MTAATVDLQAPDTTTEDVPAHIAAGLTLAQAIEDVAEQFGTQLQDAVRRHIASAEAIPGFPPSLMGPWEDEVATPVDTAVAAIRAAAEAARSAAERERTELMPAVEAADGSPADSDLSQSSLRPR